MADDSKRPELLRLSDGSIGRFGLDCLIVAGNPKVSRAGSLPPDTGSLSAKRRRMTCRSSKNRISIYIYTYIYIYCTYPCFFSARIKEMGDPDISLHGLSSVQNK